MDPFANYSREFQYRLSRNEVFGSKNVERKAKPRCVTAKNAVREVIANLYFIGEMGKYTNEKSLI